jgi:MinD-like ATPase involved in chromosome partitioning or flagellar assembly
MGLVSLVSAKGAPGVTTTALALAALWPRHVLLADCDPAGGDVALRMPGEGGEPIDRDRGLLSLAAVSRRGLSGMQVREHVQRLEGGLEVLAGVRSPEQAAASEHLWSALGSALDAMEGTDVIADCGRVAEQASHSLALPVLRSSRLVVLVARPEAASVIHLRERIETLSESLRSRSVDGVPLGVLVVASPTDKRGVEGVRQVLARDDLPVTFLGQVAWDEKGAAVFHGQPPTGRIEKSLLVRSVREATTRLAQGLEPYWSHDPAAPGATEDESTLSEPTAGSAP